MKLPMMMLHQRTTPPQTNTHTPPPMSVKLNFFLPLFCQQSNEKSLTKDNPNFAQKL